MQWAEKLGVSESVQTAGLKADEVEAQFSALAVNHTHVSCLSRLVESGCTGHTCGSVQKKKKKVSCSVSACACVRARRGRKR